MYAGGISTWIENMTGANVLLKSKEVSYHIEKLKAEGLIEFYQERKVKGKTRGTVRRYHRITDKGRIEIIALREALKMLFSDPPAETKHRYRTKRQENQ